MKTGFFQSVSNAIVSLLKWFAGFFQDGKNSASSKRAIVYIATYLLCVIVFATKDGKWADNAMNMQIYWGIVFIVLFGIDAIKKESISKIIESKFGVKDIETDEKKVTTVEQIDTKTN
jgi:hypothetical protein